MKWASKNEVELQRKKLSLPFVLLNIFGRSVDVNLLSRDDKTFFEFHIRTNYFFCSFQAGIGLSDFADFPFFLGLISYQLFTDLPVK